MDSKFTGQMIISNTRTTEQRPFPIDVTFSFDNQTGNTWSVGVGGLTPEHFPVSAAGINDTVTATPSAATGSYDAGHGAMSVALNVLFTDTGGHLPQKGELVPFALSTSGAITQQSAGMDAHGSPLDAKGGISLVGSARISVSVAIFSVSVTIGVNLVGTLAPLPPAAA